MPKKSVVRNAVTQPSDPSYRLIALTQGQTAIVDTEDYERLMQRNWSARWSVCTKTFYAISNEFSKKGVKPKTVYMAREVLQCDPKQKVDHRDRDTLNNRKKNLRIATSSQNKINQGLYANNTSGYKGVSWSKQNRRWIAHISYLRKKICLGLFKSKEDAARAYDRAAKKFYGDFAVLNLPNEMPQENRQ